MYELYLIVSQIHVWYLLLWHFHCWLILNRYLLGWNLLCWNLLSRNLLRRNLLSWNLHCWSWLSWSSHSWIILGRYLLWWWHGLSCSLWLCYWLCLTSSIDYCYIWFRILFAFRTKFSPPSFLVSLVANNRDCNQNECEEDNSKDGTSSRSMLPINLTYCTIFNN